MGTFLLGLGGKFVWQIFLSDSVGHCTGIVEAMDLNHGQA